MSLTVTQKEFINDAFTLPVRNENVHTHTQTLTTTWKEKCAVLFDPTPTARESFRGGFCASLKGAGRIGTLYRTNHTRLSSLEVVALAVVDALDNALVKITRVAKALIYMVGSLFSCKCRQNFMANLGVFLGSMTSLCIEPVRFMYTEGKHALGAIYPPIANADSSPFVRTVFGVTYVTPKPSTTSSAYFDPISSRSHDVAEL